MTTRDQRRHWNALRQKNTPPTRQRGPSPFARHCATRFSSPSRIVELGCGPAHDSAYFAGLGHTVCATDFSIAALDPASSIYAAVPGHSFCLLDIAAPLPFRDGALDVIYARLSLHYFSDRVTRAVFRELRRVLGSGGLHCFMCKSTADPLFGQGELIEPDMFERNGHLRHFFSPAYATACLGPAFTVLELQETRGDAYGRDSAYVEVIAQAR